jgi:hypothetical protein
MFIITHRYTRMYRDFLAEDGKPRDISPGIYALLEDFRRIVTTAYWQ